MYRVSSQSFQDADVNLAYYHGLGRHSRSLTDLISKWRSHPAINQRKSQRNSLRSQPSNMLLWMPSKITTVSCLSPAGTGKTFLAMEAAKKTSKSGKKVALICFNRLLREWMSSQ